MRVPREQLPSQSALLRSPRGAPPAAAVLALQRRAGNAAVQSVARTPKAIPQGPVTGKPPAPITCAAFKKEAAERFGIRSVRFGTCAEQTRELRVPKIPGWKAWHPEDPSSAYRAILDGIADFATAYGGIPPIRSVVFYETDYATSGTATSPRPEVGASFGDGNQLAIYKRFMTMNKGLPVGRSDKKGNHPKVGATISGPAGEVPGAPVPYVSPEASRRRVIVHELGHGLAGQMLTPGEKTPARDADFVRTFEKAVGWHGGRLYDIGDPRVAKAIKAGTAPSAAPITETDWNAPKWVEQPVSAYSVSAPEEDLSETLMAYAYAPELLRARSPRRHKWVQDHKASWPGALTSKKPAPPRPTKP